MQPLLFVHIPKTAGTSFRKAYSSLIPENSTFCDYGEKSEETSQLVKKLIITQNDLWAFKKAFDSESGLFLTGHYPAIRYLHLFGVANTITFIREPLPRIRSEYEHFVRNYDFKGSFADFYEKPHFINRQSKLLRGVPIPAIAMVGITEQFARSLAMFEMIIKRVVPFLELNKGNGNIDHEYEFTVDDRQRLEKLNQADIDLYRKAYSWHEVMLQTLWKEETVVRGEISSIHKGSIHGWAVADDEHAVEIGIFRNNQLAGKCQAKLLRPHLRALGIARGGCVGFYLNIPELKVGDLVRAQVMQTGQPLYGGELQIKQEHL